MSCVVTEGRVRLAITLDPDAFAELVRQHQALVFSLARHILGQAEEAEEVAQEVFCKLYQHGAEINSEQHLVFWLRQVATRQAVDRWRRQRLRPRLGLEQVPEPAVAPSEPDPWRQERLRRAVAALPLEQRVAIVLRYQEELEPREIARLLGVSVHTIKSRLQRGLQALRSDPVFCQPEGEGLLAR